jgi:VanZ family protein
MPVKTKGLFVKYWLPVLIWMTLIFYLSGRPGKDIPALFPFQDIVFHFLAYLALAYFFGRALKNTNRGLSNASIFIYTFAFAICYALSDEFHQSFIPGRNTSAFDVFIDGLGVIPGALSHRWLR